MQPLWLHLTLGGLDQVNASGTDCVHSLNFFLEALHNNLAAQLQGGSQLAQLNGELLGEQGELFHLFKFCQSLLDLVDPLLDQLLNAAVLNQLHMAVVFQVQGFGVLFQCFEGGHRQ